jgi:amino acid transporter
MVFIQCVAMSMAELCSSMPTSGGLYYAACVLAPSGFGPLAAWITGWSNWLAQVTGAPSVDYALSAMILAAVSINDPTYTPQNYQIFLLTTLIMLIHGCISSMPTKWIAEFNSYGSTFNIVRTIRSKADFCITYPFPSDCSAYRDHYNSIRNEPS